MFLKKLEKEKMTEQAGADELAGMMMDIGEDEEEDEAEGEEVEEMEEEEEEEENVKKKSRLEGEGGEGGEEETTPVPQEEAEKESYDWKENVLDVLSKHAGLDIPYVCISAAHPEERGYRIHPNGRASPVMGVLVECLYKMQDLEHVEPMIFLNWLNALKFPDYHVPPKHNETSHDIEDGIREIQYFADSMSKWEDDFLLCFQDPSGRIWCRPGKKYNQLNSLIYFLTEYFAQTKVFDVGAIEGVIQAGERADQLIFVETKTVDVFRDLVKGIKL